MRKIAINLVVGLLCINAVFAQTKVVTGKVTDASNSQALSGVTVLAKNFNASAMSGTDGTFSLTVPQKTTTLIFSYVGYKST